MAITYFENLPSRESLTEAGLNETQIDTLYHLVDSHCTEGDPHYYRERWIARSHVKRFGLAVHGDRAFVVVTCGLIGEKAGTMQVIFCRDTWTGTIGPKGGLKPVDHSKHANKTMAKASPLIYGWRGM
jgi:hypothetical protein